MSQTIKDFLEREDIKKIKEQSPGELASESFFRDPFRPITINSELFYAPADGVVLYIKEVAPDEPYEIKGTEFTVRDLLADPDYKEQSLVCGIFMTALDVHVNRVPASAYYLDVIGTNPIQTHGVSMLAMENHLLEDFGYKKEDMEYLRYNEKKVSKFSCPAIKGIYYLVQIADREIDVILNWRKGEFVAQGTRFGAIRYGSQCDLVIPLKKNIYYENMVKPLEHVEAGIDAIFKIRREK